MATLDSTPVRELSDIELRKRLLQLGYDVPVSVNREFLVRKLENASSVAGGGGGGGSKSKKRHSMAAAPSPTPQGTGSPSTVRKRKSMAATPNAKNSASGHSYQNNAGLSTPQQQYMGSPASTMSMGTPSTPSPIVSRLNSPSSNTPHGLNNGEPPSHHTPRYLNYYNMFKASPSGSDGSSGSGEMGGGGGGGGYGYQYNRGIRMSAPGSFNPVTSVAPPSRSSERNGYSTGGASSASVEPDWRGGHFVPKLLLMCFVLFFVIIGGLYLSKNLGSVDPRGLTGSVESEGSKAREPQPPPVPPPPAKKKIDLPPPTSMRFPVCGLKGVDPEACISKDVVKNSRSLFNLLKDELTQRARHKGCQDVQEIVTLKEAKSILYNLISNDLKKTDVDSAFEGMLLLVTENPRSGLSLHGKDDEQEIHSKDVSSLDYTITKISATGINPDFLCVLTSFAKSSLLYLILLAATGGACISSWKGYHFLKSRKQAQEEEIFRMVEKVLEILYQHFEVSQNSQSPSFLAINHVRDELILPIERQRKEAFWNKVVDYISKNESRVREEIQNISGEEFKVWRWLPTASPLASKRFSSTANSHHHQSRNRFSMPAAPMMTSSPVVPSTSAPVAGPSHASMPPPQSQNNLYPSLSSMANCSDDDDGMLNGSGDANFNNKWQGQAFETCEGSPNALPSTPTTCLKIRHMFTDKDGIKERVRIEKNILEKCCQAKILHIGIDPSSVEGCVYVRCLSKEDAGKAFQALHGWWFDGHLLSVKFLREERYFSRFPDAKHVTLPMGLPR